LRPWHKQVSHRYSQEELQKLECFESIDYLPACSRVYGDWLRTQPIGRYVRAAHRKQPVDTTERTNRGTAAAIREQVRTLITTRSVDPPQALRPLDHDVFHRDDHRGGGLRPVWGERP